MTITDRLREHLFGTLVYAAFNVGCDRCEMWKDTLAVRHRNSAYHEKHLNWLYSCEECYEDDLAYFADLLAYYYSSR